ncbi:MAG: Na(+)/H(+) antiporter subunit A [Chlorobiaceae bacterium]|nr:Na(+)/H(+) antiporter subunit A [Chlorobiaceae bacterium]MBA4310212.1 Na(+)/H(+) antiporter subunit A [Chlorobiaceae bacterium]
MIEVILLSFLSAFLLPLFFRFNKKLPGIISTLVAFFLFIYFASTLPTILSGNVIKESTPWFPAVGINFSFYLDGLSLLFALLITGIGTVVFLYASKYMEDYKYSARFFVYLTSFMASMLGLVLSDNLILLFIFLELTSVTSFLLIGFKHEKESSRYAALQALIVTGTGGLILFAGIIAIGIIAGTFNISDLLSNQQLIVQHSAYGLILFTFLLGAFTKSAQFPFHFWLPSAMEAPTPVSAYLHSATMVKAGVFLLARMNPILGGTELWQNSLILFGTITMLFAILTAVKQTDLKKILAYSTVSILGTLVMLIGIGTDFAIRAMIITLIAHAIYKATLFLISGTIDSQTGTRDVTKLRGLKDKMPITFATAILAMLSMFGIIPFLGFIGKETLLDSVIRSGLYFPFLPIIVFVSSVFVIAVASIVVLRPFLFAFKKTPRDVTEAPFRMWIGPALLSLLGLVFGISATYSLTSIVNSVSASIFNFNSDYTIKLWYGFNLNFFLSVLIVLVGLVFYRYRNIFIKIVSHSAIINYVKPSFWYDKFISGLNKLATTQTSLLQTGFLRHYIIIIMLAFIVFVGYTFFRNIPLSEINPNFNSTTYEKILAGVIVISAFFVVKAKSRLYAIISMGVVGYSIAIIFVLYGAPDLALTQFAIETLSVILFVFVLYKLPKYQNFSHPTRRMRDFLIAGSSGLIITLIVFYVTSIQLQSEVKKFFSETSLPIGMGRNVVNVIIVDFRALDTLGEITVLGIAAIGVFSMLKLILREEKN